jgi:hypothetical protein
VDTGAHLYLELQHVTDVVTIVLSVLSSGFLTLTLSEESLFAPDAAGEVDV